MHKIFDCHIHIINKGFPLVENNNYIPAEFKISDYNNAVKKLHVVGGVVVSGSFHGFDQQYLIKTLNDLGNNFVGVAQLSDNVSDSEIVRLHKLGVRGIRFNVKRLDPIEPDSLAKFAMRVYDLANWHTELYIESSKIDKYYSVILELPSVSLDHLGLTKKGFPRLLQLVEKGVKVKATGFGRVDFDPLSAMKEIISIDSESLMFGTDLPSIRTKKPFKNSDIELIKNNFSDEIQQKIFCDNAMSFYRIKGQHSSIF